MLTPPAPAYRSRFELPPGDARGDQIGGTVAALEPKRHGE